MRRKDREITSTSKILAILDECKVLRLAMSLDNMPYIIPLNFGYSYENEVLTLYFHSAKEGKKLDIMRQNESVCFELDCNHKLTPAKNACGYGYNFSSIIGTGKAEILENLNDKKHALTLLMKHQSGKDFEFSDSEASAVAVFKVTADSFSAKARD